MHLLLLGSTGGTGRHLLTLALEAGHRVTVLVRDPSRLECSHPDLRVVQGDATDVSDLLSALDGVDAVISVIGAPPSSRAGVRGRSARALLTAMQQAGVRRLISLSSLGVGDSAARMPWYLTWLIVPFYLRRAFDDHEVQERHIRGSDVDWTLVRPTFMNDKPATGRIQDLARVEPREVGLSVTRADVARFMLDQLDRTQWVGRTAELVGQTPAAA